jgi:hypothetical protein
MATCVSIGPVVDYLCKQDTTLAELDAGNGRGIKITGRGCWDYRDLSYEVKDQSTVVSPKYMFGLDTGEYHTYSLVHAENKSLVGVLDITTKPFRLIAIYDFRSGDSWPRLRENESYDDAQQRKWPIMFQKLSLENPDLISPFESKVD